ncbi:FkbM family methyltransferase [Geodermatophilus sp. DSM 45219]|uniref:FkbM family methyltransferase n=1 Tax=Geodermatophilus sp. DSM 45219 TaxID=1881103 RepID=UPI000890BABC|nr:FkbM family methyltransferase [Geodermatophilus sp. DSM 45219]SDN55040.1 methyltransferase, FkbM family [Geodermatophilus sp. DSM 45219]
MDARALFHRTSVATLNRLAATPRLAYAVFAMIGLHDHWRDHASEELRFLAFCGSLRHLSHAQILQDLWVLYELDLRTGGYFVEFGAYDGTVHSNTRALEERFGWRGLLAEPNPAMAEVLRAGRTATVDQRCVWDTTGEEVELVVTGDAELSTVAEHAAHDLHTSARIATTVERVAVPTVSLDDLLAEHDVPAGFDFLSVDTEGTELRILRAFDVERWRPRLIAVEHNGRRDQEAELDTLLGAHGYERRFRQLSDWDAWYRLRT